MLSLGKSSDKTIDAADGVMPPSPPARLSLKKGTRRPLLPLPFGGDPSKSTGGRPAPFGPSCSKGWMVARAPSLPPMTASKSREMGGFVPLACQLYLSRAISRPADEPGRLAFRPLGAAGLLAPSGRCGLVLCVSHLDMAPSGSWLGRFLSQGLGFISRFCYVPLSAREGICV